MLATIMWCPIRLCVCYTRMHYWIHMDPQVCSWRDVTRVAKVGTPPQATSRDCFRDTNMQWQTVLAIGIPGHVRDAQFRMRLVWLDGGGGSFAHGVAGKRPCVSRVRTVWPSGLRRWLKAPVRKGVGSNPTAVMNALGACVQLSHARQSHQSRRPCSVAAQR